MCAFWDTALRDWSSEGCRQVGITNQHVFCRCNHLTAFTALVVSHKKNELNMNFIITVSCVYSVIDLLIRLIGFMYTSYYFLGLH